MRKRLIAALVMLGVALAATLAYRLVGGFADWAAGAVSRPAGARLSAVSARLSFPVGEALVAALVLSIAACGIRAAALSAAHRSARPLSGFCAGVALLISAALLGYSMLWTPLYHARPLSEWLGIAADGRYTPPELTELCAELVGTANVLAETAAAGPLTGSANGLAERVNAALSSIDELPLVTHPVKIARYPELFKALGIAGVYFPWTGEVIVSADEPPLSLPFLYAHEAAHQAGFAREDEANYVAFLACARGDRYMNYSGATHALHYAMEALRSADPVAWAAQRARMNPAVRRDYERLNGQKDAAQPALARIGGAIAALRPFGGHGYGEMVDLLIAARRSS